MVTAGASTVRYGVVGQSPNRTYVDRLRPRHQGEQRRRQRRCPGARTDPRGLEHRSSVKYRAAQHLANGQTATLGFQGAGGASASTVMPIGCNAKVLDDNINDVGWSIAPLPICGNGINRVARQRVVRPGRRNGTATSCCTVSCGFRAGGSTCRVGGGAPCDLNETCTGSSATCPADDAPGKAGITCRLGSGDFCDPDEVCNGVPGIACPGDIVQTSSTQCRAGSGDLCDPSETCSGIAGAPCPANVVSPSSTVCRPGSGDICDGNESCSGLAGAPCPNDDAPFNAGVVCRGGSGDVCDLNESCTGTPGATCPADDAPGNAGIVCRPSSVARRLLRRERDLHRHRRASPARRTTRRQGERRLPPGSGDLCDPDERCNGLTGQGCPPDVVANPTTVCRAGSGDSCDPDETCTAIPGMPCPANIGHADTGPSAGRRPGSATLPRSAPGTSGQACPANAAVGAGTECEADGDICTVDACNGSGSCVTTAPGRLRRRQRLHAGLVQPARRLRDHAARRRRAVSARSRRSSR